MLNAFRNLHSPGKNGRVFLGGGGGGTVSRTNDQLLKFRHLLTCPEHGQVSLKTEISAKRRILTETAMVTNLLDYE